MPSPIAHAAVALLAPPLTPAGDRARLSWPRWLGFYALVTLVLCVPDTDFAIPLFTGFSAHEAHGAWTHSLIAGVAGGGLFAVAARAAVGPLLSGARLMLLGVGCYWVHLLMDTLTSGRGIMLLWPITDTRIRAPFSLFTGIHWSDPGRWDLHYHTAVNEGLFVLIVAAVAGLLEIRSRRATALGGAA